MNNDGITFYRPDVDKYTTSESLVLKDDDTNIGIKGNLTHWGENKEGTVKRRKKNYNWSLTGIKNSKSILNSHIYEVEFPYGKLSEYYMNALTENFYSQIDEQGKSYSIFSRIIDHYKQENCDY